MLRSSITSNDVGLGDYFTNNYWKYFTNLCSMFGNIYFVHSWQLFLCFIPAAKSKTTHKKILLNLVVSEHISKIPAEQLILSKIKHGYLHFYTFQLQILYRVVQKGFLRKRVDNLLDVQIFPDIFIWYSFSFCYLCE